jgi:hypothetical protein
MVRYTLPQSPEIILTVKGKDSAKAREEAMDRLMELMDEGKLPTELWRDLGPSSLLKLRISKMLRLKARTRLLKPCRF